MPIIRSHDKHRFTPSSINLDFVLGSYATGVIQSLQPRFPCGGLNKTAIFRFNDTFPITTNASGAAGVFVFPFNACSYFNLGGALISS